MAQLLKPIMQEKFSFKKHVLKQVHVFAGLDRGCSLTKIIYVEKSDADKLDKNSKSEFIILTVALFHNSNFDDALIWLSDKAVFPENKEYPFHLTGVGGFTYGDKIKKFLGRDVLFIDEFMAQSRGSYYLLTNAPLNEITFDEVKTDCTESFDIPVLKNVKQLFEEKVGKWNEAKSMENVLPCIFCFGGSAIGLTYIGSDGSFRISNVVHNAGKTFMGLSRCILGSNDYKEITAMAERGDRRNVDIQVKDILPNKTENDTMQKDLPVVYMGKLANSKNSIKEFNKDDIAHSLVSMFMYNAINTSISACLSEKVSNVFFGGNLFQGEIFRKEFSTLKKMYGLDFLNFHFVSNGHTGALGAMICMPEDKEKYLNT